MVSEKPSEPIVRPDIDWIPSFKVYKERVARLAALRLNRPTTVPEGWPAQIDNARAFSGSDFKSEDEYIIRFSAEDISEIESGLAHFKGTTYTPPALSTVPQHFTNTPFLP